jgi:hypothetical protein
MAVLVDAHVHFHPRFEVQGFLDAAWRNFQEAWHGHLAENPGPSAPSGCALLLADPHGWDSLARLRTEVTNQGGPWFIRETDDDGAITVGRDGGERLVLVAGSQVATREGLEVLALATTARFPPGASFAEALDRALELDAVTVIPWGFGKWLGRRGRIIRAAIESQHQRGFFLGDNGGRLAGTPTPRLIRYGASKGILNLPGSDPLPFAPQQERAGSRGAMLPGRLDSDAPLGDLRGLLGAIHRQPPTFGRGVGIREFAVSQVRMQLRSRFGMARGTDSAPR